MTNKMNHKCHFLSNA